MGLNSIIGCASHEIKPHSNIKVYGYKVEWEAYKSLQKASAILDGNLMVEGDKESYIFFKGTVKYSSETFKRCLNLSDRNKDKFVTSEEAEKVLYDILFVK